MRSSTPRRPIGALALAFALLTGLFAGLLAPMTVSAAPQAAPPALVLTPVATLVSPIAITTRAGSTDLYVAERAGRVRRLHVGEGGEVTVAPGVFLDITGYISTAAAGGLYSLAFDPTGARLYVHFTNTKGHNRLVEYTMSNGGTGPTVDLSTRRVVLKVRQGTTFHKGGDIAFGPDGRLYLALGDGDESALDDVAILAQDRRSILGKILRINPRASATRPYRSPLGNPFVGRAPQRPEIWAYGLRNPWRMSFDGATGNLYVADVGEHTQEEVNVLLADADGRNAGRGANLGWPRMEGTLPFNGGTEPWNHSRPAFTYGHGNGDCSIIGGFVYRGTDIAGLRGTYVYGDRCTGRIGGVVLGGARSAGSGAATEASSMPSLGISVPGGQLQSFGQGADGALYVLLSGGQVSRIDPAPAP